MVEAAGGSRESYTLWADFWKAPSHPTRLRILEALREEGSLNVSQRVARIGIGQGHLSNHLACLKISGLVQTQATGRLIYYSLADSRMPPLLALGESIFSDHGAGVATCAVAPVQGQSGHHRAPSALVLHENHAYGEIPSLKAGDFARQDGNDSLGLALN